jgi:hypothetical protein
MGNIVEFKKEKEAEDTIVIGVFCPLEAEYDNEAIGDEIYKATSYGIMTPPSLFTTEVNTITDEMLQVNNGTLKQEVIKKIGIELIFKDLIENLSGGLYICDNNKFVEVAELKEILNFIEGNNKYRIDIIEYEIEFEEDEEDDD